MTPFLFVGCWDNIELGESYGLIWPIKFRILFQFLYPADDILKLDICESGLELHDLDP